MKKSFSDLVFYWFRKRRNFENCRDVKNIILFSAFFVTLSFQTGTAQTAVGGCDSVTVTSTPPYSPNIFFIDVNYKQCKKIGESCCRVITSGSPATPKFYLEKKDGGDWKTVAGPQLSSIFDDLNNGTYRVRINIPVVAFNICKGGEAIKLYNLLGQFIGWWGTWSDEDYFTNEVLVGPTNESDIGYTFIDPTPNDPFEEGYDYGELVKMNTSASQNYDLWWLAIFETGPTNHRYRTMNWTYGTVPNDEIDLTNFWKGPNNTWKFETFHQYTVQFVVENSKCRNGIEFPNPNGWNNLNRSFFICPAGSGCRFGTGGREITISPNPAGSVIHLENFEPDLDRDYRLTIADMSGKIVRSIPLITDRVDISDLGSGMFIVSIFREGEQVFSSKLVVNK